MVCFSHDIETDVNDPSVDCSDPVSFKTGYLDHHTNSWINHYTVYEMTMLSSEEGATTVDD